MIHAAVERSGKKLVLLLDNMDRIFDNVGEDAQPAEGRSVELQRYKDHWGQHAGN